jgi:cytochrome c553
MSTIRRTLVAAAGCAALAAAALAQAADAGAGAAKAKEVCAACHGLDGNSPASDFPRLGGQNADYLAHSLHAYKDGRRKNPIMAGFAGALTAQDIENVSAYYASQPPVLFIEHYKFDHP